MNHLFAAIALLLAIGAGGRAATFSKESTADLVLRAERVCCVRCERIEARRDARTGLVFTYVRMRVLEDLAGTGNGPTLDLRMVGGRAGNVETRVAGMPKFRGGEECILLLGKKNRAGYPVVLQAARGAIPLKKTKTGARVLGSFVTGFADLKGPRVTLDSFRGAVKRAVAARDAKRRAQKERGR